MSLRRILGTMCPGVFFAILSWLAAVPAVAQLQTPAPSATPAGTGSGGGDGKEIGGYRVTQSVEFGGRITSVSGSEAMYDTLVNQQSGPRLLEQTLTMQSLTHQDWFDSLSGSSFGWGGDPEQAARLNVSKYRWYNFTGSYRHMQNYFDYNLLANQLNPPTGVPFLPIVNSPHSFYNTQNLYNFGIVMLPLRKVSFRFDYNRNRFIGPSFSSLHEGTEALTNQDWNNTLNGYRFGADWRAARKTTLSYTQVLQYYSGETSYSLSPYNSWPLPNGAPVSLGLPWFNGGSPCSSPLQNGIANPNCNGFFSYGYAQRLRTSTPTEQFNLKSSSIKHLDFNGQFQYSGANSSGPIVSVLNGLTTRSAVRGYDMTGSNSSTKWKSVSSDASATYRLTDKLRLVEAFHWRFFDSGGSYLNVQSNYFSPASVGSVSLLTPLGSFPATNLLHSSSSPADLVNELTVNIVSQDMKQNNFQVQYDIARTFGVRAGFIWTNSVIQPGNTYQAAVGAGDIYYPNLPNRGNCVGLPLNADGSCTFTGELAPWGSPTTEINRYAGLIGAWYQKGNALHANLDIQFGSADNYVYRIDPRRFSTVSGNVSYTPTPWASVGANFFYNQGSNHTGDINYNGHNYHTVLSATLTPNKHWALDAGYSFDALQQNANVCYAGSVNPPGSYTCLGDSSLLETYGMYQTHTQFGYFTVVVTPIERVTVRAGYSVVSNQGDTTQFNLLLPLGPLSSTYQLPLAAVEIGLYRNVIFKAGWNYNQYAEGSFVGPTAPRYFHANRTVLALKYAF